MKNKNLEYRMPLIIEIFVVLTILTSVFLVIKENLQEEKYIIVNFENFKKISFFDRFSVYYNIGPEKIDQFTENKIFKDGLFDLSDVEHLSNLIKKAKKSEHNQELNSPYYFCFRTGKDFICLKVNINKNEKSIIGENWQSKEAYEFLKKRLNIYEFKDINEPFSKPITIP